MNTPVYLSPDFKSSWNGLALILHLAELESSGAKIAVPVDPHRAHDENAAACTELEPFLDALVLRLARATGAGEASVLLRQGGREHVASYPPVLPYMTATADKGSFCATRLFAPVTAGDDAIGCIEVRTGDEDDGFTTLHKKLVLAVARFLGLCLEHGQKESAARSCTDSLALHFSLQNMIHRVWQATEQPPQICEDALNAVGIAVTKAIPASAALITLWDEHSTLLPAFAASSDPAAMSTLRETVRWHASQHSKVGPVFLRSSRSRNEAPWDGMPGMKPLTAVIMVPLTRLKRWRGVLALGRTDPGAEFNTVEKRALHIVSGLIRDPESVPTGETLC